MKRPVLETLRQVVSAVVCGYPGGRECAAPRLGYELKQFDNRVYEDAGSRPLAYDQIHQLEMDAGTTHLRRDDIEGKALGVKQKKTNKKLRIMLEVDG